MSAERQRTSKRQAEPNRRASSASKANARRPDATKIPGRVGERPAAEHENTLWREAHEELARLLESDPEFAAYWNHPLDEDTVEDAVVARARSRAFAKKAHAARYGDSAAKGE